MSLTLSSPEADRLARSLAALTGESVEQAVEHAIRDQLAREQERRQAQQVASVTKPADVAQILRDVQAISRRFRRHAGQPFTSLDHGELLYDEAGLPR